MPNGKVLRLETRIVDEQIPGLLQFIGIEPELVPVIQDTYNKQVKKLTQDERGEQLENLKKKLASLENEEARLARLYMTGNINETTFAQLRREWLEKTRSIQIIIQELQVNARSYLDDLEVALVLMTNLSRYFPRLEDKKKTNLLQTIFKKIVVDGNGDIITFELHSPFTYLFTLASRMNSKSEEGCGSSQVSSRPFLENELPGMPVEQFLASLRFEQRGKMDQLGIEIGSFD